jgi:hypothetical protein
MIFIHFGSEVLTNYDSQKDCLDWGCKFILECINCLHCNNHCTCEDIPEEHEELK